MPPTLKRFAALLLGFFVLYALTAQRGLGWGDSGEFQHRILHLGDGLVSGCDSFATAHPLYVAFAKFFCSTPFQITLVSSFFGALAVAGFYGCTGSVAGSVLFGMSHAVWWLSCVSEVYTMSLAFLVLEMYLLRKFVQNDRRWGMALFFVNGLHLALHNIALLSIPVYGVMLLVRLRGLSGRERISAVCLTALVWAAGASYWLYSLCSRGAADVLFGGYGAQTFGFMPARWQVAAFNWALSGISLFVPVCLLVKAVRRHGFSAAGGEMPMRWAFGALFAVHFAFWVRYFIVSQFTFVLPPLLLLWLFVSTWGLQVKKWEAWAGIQVLLPVIAYLVLSGMQVPEWRRSLHPHRDEAAYFALPWKFNDDSADRAAAEYGGVWNGYPDYGRGGAK